MKQGSSITKTKRRDIPRTGRYQGRLRTQVLLELDDGALGHAADTERFLVPQIPRTDGSGTYRSHRRSDIRILENTLTHHRHEKERSRAASIPERIPAPPRRDLNRLRSQATYYKEYSSIENIALLGEDYIRKMKRDLTPKTFQTSILCRRLGIAKDGFYPR